MSVIHPQLPQPPKKTPMAQLLLAIFLIVFGLNIVIGLNLPMWLIGALALVTGILILMERFRVRMDRKP